MENDKEKLTVREDFLDPGEHIDFNDYDEYEEPAWYSGTKQTSSVEPTEEEYRRMFPDEEVTPAQEKGSSWWQRQGEKRQEKKKEKFETRLQRERRERLELERKVELQKGHTTLQELRRRERRAKGKPTYAKAAGGLVKAGTLGGPIKRQNLELYTGKAPRGTYVPTGMRQLTSPGSPSLGIGGMRSLTTPKSQSLGIGGMRSLTTPSGVRSGGTDMRQLTTPQFGMLRSAAAPRVRNTSPLANRNLVVPSTRLTQTRTTLRTPKYYRKMKTKIRNDRLY